MILIELHIQDYKQFAGEHVFAPASEGVVAVIGQNGAGKTTLFEAIEWCLYQPREIQLDEVAPRGRVAKPRVQLTLMNPHTGERYVIVRSLSRGRVADAEIYREEDPDNRIVKGSRQVTDYVARTLIGLSHRAFVSTFFTRQKELTFFGDLKETERRREVGRLLGMETIREAQKLIGDDRNDAQTQAKVFEIQGREAAADRDFVAEGAEADQRIAAASAQLATATDSLAQAEASFVAIRADVERLTSLEREHARLSAALERIEGDIRAQQASRDAALGELARMDAAAAERATLATVAAGLETHRATVQAHDLARERHLQAQRLRAELDRARITDADAALELKASVTGIVGPSIDGWMWSAADDATPLAAADRLISVATTIDLDAAAARADALLKAEKFGQDLEQALAQAASFRAFMDKLVSERKAMLATGDPHQLREQALRRREEAMRTVDHAQARTAAIIEETDRLRPVLDRLRAQQDGAICPTCGRPIEANDIEITAGLFTARLESLDDERAALASQRAAASTEAKTIERVITTEAERAKQLDMLLGRIANGEQRIADAEQGALDIRSALTHHLDAHGMAAPPSSDEIETVKRRFETSRRIAGSLPLLRRLAASMRQAQEDARALETELAAAGDVAYDPSAHDTVRAALKSAENALARIGQIDALLAARPEREAEIAAAESGIARLADERTGLIGAQATLAFDPAALLQARTAERDAIQAERDARDARAAALAHEADAVKHRDALLAEHERIRRLIERADRRLREAGELDLMYREFNGFEQFVADRLTPQLADYTAELLRAITEEKYDDVVFNSNYGIRVFDGSDEHFPVDEFSGGERDVIALCARLALSRLIGGQAHNPPGFMVLDEVFGSLDRERRGQVLETLGALAGTAEAFHQLFIISHVDDVRSSPIFNEVWRVAEGVDGISRLENLNLTGGFEDA